MGKHHRDRDRDRDRDMMDDPRMGDPRMGDPRMRDPRMRDPRMRDPRMRDPRNMGDPGASGAAGALGNAGNVLRNIAGNINLGELLKGVDINQIIGLITTLAGVNNMNLTQFGSMLRNLDLNDLNKGPMPGPGPAPGAAHSNNMSVDDMKSQLSILADKLEQMGKGQNNSVQDELLKAVNTLQQSPELMNMFNSFVNANMPKPPNKE